jgi:hypothetical protein
MHHVPLANTILLTTARGFSSKLHNHMYQVCRGAPTLTNVWHLPCHKGGPIPETSYVGVPASWNTFTEVSSYTINMGSISDVEMDASTESPPTESTSGHNVEIGVGLSNSQLSQERRRMLDLVNRLDNTGYVLVNIHLSVH